MPTKAKVKRKKFAHKKVAVTREFLTSLATSIYDSKRRKFLRLCNGTLQNGPDPTNAKRPMHCGLGELYLAMTGRQPEDDGVNEDDVVDLAVKLSPLAGLREKATQEERNKFKKAISFVKKLDLPAALTKTVIDHINDADEGELDKYVEEDDRDDVEHHFRRALDMIPVKNDDGIEEETCDITNYKDRSKRVAAQLREAARLLP